MRADELAGLVAGMTGPVIVVAQAGNVNTGGFDPIDAIADALAGHPNAWVHVDGAFGLWAAASPRLRHLVGRRRPCGLLGNRCSQVAQRWLRLRVRRRSRRRSAPGGDGGVGLVPDADPDPARVVGVRPRQLTAGPWLRPVRHPPLAGALRGSGAGRALLRPGAPDGGTPVAGRGRGDPERGGAEPGARSLPPGWRWRRGARRSDPPGPGDWRGLDGRDDLARPRRDADQRQQLVDHRGGHRSHRRGDRGSRPTRPLGRRLGVWSKSALREAGR